MRETATGAQLAAPPPARESPQLVAYRFATGSPMPLEPAPVGRPWMDAAPQRFAYRCLPLLIANESGWLLRSTHTVLATWDGGTGRDALQVEHLSGEPPLPAASHFGHGILTWRLPYLFRTSPGWNLLLRGPANWPLDGAAPLEGVIESDWTAATATMNWKLTRPGLTVRFAVGDPIAMLVPQRRNDLEEVQPVLRDLASDPDLHSQHGAWAASRDAFLQRLAAGDRDTTKQGWEKHYFQGVSPGGAAADEHQRKLRLRRFTTSDR